MYAAQLQAGLLEAELAAEADRFARSWIRPRLVRAAQELRAACSAAGLLPVVVSASPLPIVRAAGPLAGFTEVAGIEVRVRDGRFTDEVLHPVTYAEGKLEAVSRFGPLVLACGDSHTGDLALLSAARIPVVVAPATGSPLATEALRRGWPILNQD